MNEITDCDNEQFPKVVVQYDEKFWNGVFSNFFLPLRTFGIVIFFICLVSLYVQTNHPYQTKQNIEKSISNEKQKKSAKKKSTKKNFYILSFSDTRVLTEADLKGLSKRKLRLARNEIYARHGRKFSDAALQKYFNNQKWYHGYIEPENFVEEEKMTKLEIKNAKFILEYEQK